MTMTRRHFFRLAGAGAATALLPVPTAKALSNGLHYDAPQFRSVQAIYCDLIHDDAPGLNAFFRGEVVEFATPEIAEHFTRCDNVLVMHDARVMVGETIVVDLRNRGGLGLQVTQNHFERMPFFYGHMMAVHTGDDVHYPLDRPGQWD